MSGLNKACLIGRVGNDPEIRSTADGTAVASFSLATSRSFKGKDGQKKETTAWHSIVIWRKLAEVVKEYVHKGALLYLEGEITYEEYEKDGVKKKTTKIVCNQMQMLGGGKGKGGPSGKPADSDFFDEEDVPL